MGRDFLDRQFKSKNSCYTSPSVIALRHIWYSAIRKSVRFLRHFEKEAVEVGLPSSWINLAAALPPLFSYLGYSINTCCTICPRSSYPFYIVTYCIKWVTTSWTYSAQKWSILWHTYFLHLIHNTVCPR